MNDLPSVRTEVSTSSIMAGPAEVLFLAAKALSLAERTTSRWPHVEGVMSRMMVRRLGGADDALSVVDMMM